MALAVPDVKILRLDYPTSAEQGQTVNISWMVLNYGGDYGYECFVRLFDLDTATNIKDERFRFSPGAGVGETWSLTMPNRDWRLSFRCGYFEFVNGRPHEVVTDERSFTIELAAPPPPTPPLWMLTSALAPVIFNLAVVLYSEGAKLALSS